jgi:DNA replication protein DnaC
MTSNNHHQQGTEKGHDVSDPFITHVWEFNTEVDRARAEDNIQRGAERCAEEVPPRFVNATVTDDRVAAWVRHLVANAASRPMMPKIAKGDSLLITGGFGVGKTHQAYGAMRALAASGVSCIWRYASAADLYGTLRDYDRGNVEERLEKYSKAAVLFLDDLGAEKWSEAKDEINYRLLNYRYEYRLPTLITTNLPLKPDPDDPDQETLPMRLGERVTSRLTGMVETIEIEGRDRRPEVRREEKRRRRGDAA